MNLGHACRQLRGKVTAAKVYIEESGLNAAMAGECRDLVYVPTCASKVRQTEVTGVWVLNRSMPARLAT